MKSFPAICMVASLLGATSLQAQWLTQTNRLKEGWNAVFLHVDASHATLEEIMPPVGQGEPIEEIWYWQPAQPTGQFVQSPLLPNSAGNQWIKWESSLPTTSPLNRLVGNGAYLVKVAAGYPTYQWVVKGRPVIPTYHWSLTGLNFLGFPTSVGTPPTFEWFTSPAPALQQNGDFYRYIGGPLDDNNPVSVANLRSVNVQRDQAYWARAGETYSQYYGPFRIVQAGTSGIQFGDTSGQASFRLRNVTGQALTVTMNLLPSEAAPAGQSPVVGMPALLLRGPLNTTNLAFGYTPLSSGPQQWVLAPAGQPGAEVEVILGLSRSAMAASPGAEFSGVLRFTDSLGMTSVDMSVSAVQGSLAGLWVGEARIDYVGHYLKPFAHATNRLDFTNLLARLQLEQGVNGYRYVWDDNTGRVLVFGGPESKTGSYLLEGPIKVDSGTVARPFHLRLILHNDGTTSRLLQKVYNGIGLTSNEVVATRQALLMSSHIDSARRISAVHLPTSAGNTPWPFTGLMERGGNLLATVNLAYDDAASNPFLHTYHPDHDNLDAPFEATQPEGVESYGVSRQMAMSFTGLTDDFDGLTRGSANLSGNYAETITFRSRNNQTRHYNILGTFTLTRVSPIAQLTTQ